MPRLYSISIENFRSIGEQPIEITFPVNSPTILIGENNSGKTNILRAIELLFGEFHPKYRKLEDHDHFGRDASVTISIEAQVSQMINRLGRLGEFTCSGFSFNCTKNQANEFYAIQGENGEHNQYVSNSLREELLCVVVNSEQNLTYQLSYATKYTLLSKVTKSFHDRLTDDSDRVDRLKGFFSQIQETFLEVDQFRDFSENMSSIAGQMLSNMSHALQFDFSAYDPSNYFKTLRVQPTENKVPRAMEELGTGQQQILALSFAHAYARSFVGQGLIFVLDEPETHLHPLAQQWLARQMYQMAEDGLQIIITTHSPYFIDLRFLEGIYLVKKSDQTTVQNVTRESLTEFCRNTGAPNARSENIIPFYQAHSSPRILSGFFSSKVILVEGETEELSLPIYLHAVGFDTLKEGIAVIGVSGKGNLAKWWRLFTCFGIPTYVCFDNDQTNDRKGTKRLDALRAIGIEHDRILEVLKSENWNINSHFCVFGRDFEITMRQSFVQYAVLEEQQTERLGSSKPIVAKAVALRLSPDASDDLDAGWASFREFRRFVENLTIDN